MKQYSLAIMQEPYFMPRRGSLEPKGNICVGNHAAIHSFLNMMNPLLTEHFDEALEVLSPKESAFIDIRNFQCCLTRTA